MEAAAKKAADREALRHVIQQWNANRLDIFELSEPNEVSRGSAPGLPRPGPLLGKMTAGENGGKSSPLMCGCATPAATRCTAKGSRGKKAKIIVNLRKKSCITFI